MSKFKKQRKLKIDEVKTENAPPIFNEQIDLTMVASVAGKGKRPKPKNLFKALFKIIKFGRPFHGYLYLSLAGHFISIFFDLMIPVYIGKCIDNIVGTGNVNFAHLMEQIWVLIGFIIAAAIFNWMAHYGANLYLYKSSAYIRDLFFKKIHTVPLGFIDKNQHGDLLSRMINDVDILTDGVLEGLSTITNGIITIIGTLIFMFILNVPLALIILIITPISLLLSMYIAKKSYSLFAQQAHNEGEINGYLEEYISGGRIVKAFNYEKQSIDDYEVINQKYYKVSQKANFFANLANPLTRFINSIVYVSVGLAGSLMVIGGTITVGLISSFLSYANSFGKPFNELSIEITELQAAVASSERVFAVLEAKDEISDSDLPELASTDGNIKVENAYFSYVPKQKLIQNFNLTVKSGQKVAIVGPTGCGKTTFINLLMRFYDLTAGAILLDGNNINEIKRDSLRNKFGMVLQESWMFGASIKDNIAYGKQNATMNEIIEVSKAAGVDDFVEHLPYGYNTMVTEGGNNISQGQKQLICIARIMLTKPPMLILDEATSNIDTRTEVKIQQAFDLLMKGRTTFVVAHRLSTIKSADIILVMNKGNIIEQGTHYELLEKHGFYYHLYNSQFAKPSDE